MFINEIYAINLAFYYLKRTANNLDKQTIYDLIYDLHFRPVDGEVLTLVMRTLDASLK